MPSKTFYPKKKVTVKARLRKPNYANYLKYYHAGSAADDPFYKTIMKLITELSFITKLESSEIKGASNEGFFFKNDKTMYLDINGRLTLAESICDRDVMITLTIQQYDFTVNNTRKVGISITASEVREVKEKD